MDFLPAVTTCLRKYATFEGRASRSEFWWFVLFNTLVGAAARIVDVASGHRDGDGVLSGLVWLALLLPSLAASCRRLHDIGRSGWWMLVDFVPLLGWLVTLYWNCSKGDAGENLYGTDPLA
jgi:uncharacterized membrane protein YhaH (DUF805 family)